MNMTSLRVLFFVILAVEVLADGQTITPAITCEQSVTVLRCAVHPDYELPDDTEHQWYQSYSNGLLGKTIPLVTGKKTKFKIRLHPFDNNTYIRSVMNSKRWKSELHSGFYKISISTKQYYAIYEEVNKTILYSELEPVIYICRKRGTLRPQIGLSSTENRIIILYKMTAYRHTFSKTDNNSILCCIYYSNYSEGDTRIVERIVRDCTKVIYRKEPVNEDKNVFAGPTTSAELSKSTNPSTPKVIVTSTEPTTSSKTNDNDSSKYNIVIPLVLATIIIILVPLMYVIIKKFCRKPSEPDQTLALETYPGMHMPFYVNMLFRRECDREIQAQEESLYEEIMNH